MNDQFTLPEQPAAEPKWWNRPARPCAGTPDDMWFFHDNANKRRLPQLVAEARARCDACPVLIECAQDALDSGDRYGFRAGVLLSGVGNRDRADRIRASMRAWRERRAHRTTLAVGA